PRRLERRAPHAADPQHGVCAPLVRQVAVGVAGVPISREDPAVAERVRRRLRLAPVLLRRRRPADEQVADLAWGGIGAVRALHTSLVAGDELSRCARTHAALKVRDADVYDLGRSDAVEDLLSEARLPPLEDRRGERLPRRDA